jgi:hypothetical protein
MPTFSVERAVSRGVGVDALDRVRDHRREDLDQVAEVEVGPLELALAQRAVDEGREHDRVDRLPQVVEGTRLDRRHRRLELGVARHQHDDRLRLEVARRGEHQAALGEAVEHDVGDDRVEGDRLQEVDRRLRAVRERRLEALVLEHGADQVDRARVVVDEQDGRAGAVHARGGIERRRAGTRRSCQEAC